ncbi:plk protein kinase [Phytophthora cinnamomi]|uniref:plk protein kinase n=1 Tax=Phytophthora cinnamomi TaxID=4785 RepID=UPI00355AB524|nr:plk protein kinase [Phytophthora cinnamomi]
MPFVRALVSIDMLRLLLQRLGVRAVRDAVTRGMQQVNGREEVAADVDPIALLTSTNIAGVVLVARQELETRANADSTPQLPRRTTVPAGRQVLHSSPKSRSSSSPCSSISSSPRCGTPRSPAADRRSILAKEGVHVLMQEKLVSFDYRGQANALPAFRVRGASASTTDSAAKRRQRGLQYANEHAVHRTVNL